MFSSGKTERWCQQSEAGQSELGKVWKSRSWCSPALPLVGKPERHVCHPGPELKTWCNELSCHFRPCQQALSSTSNFLMRVRGGKGKAQLSVGRGKRKNRWFSGHARALFFFLKGTAFKPPRQVILVYTPTEGDGPGCGPIGVSSQT